METKEVIKPESKEVEERISGRGEISFLNLFNNLPIKKSKESKYERHQGAREMERRLRRITDASKTPNN